MIIILSWYYDLDSDYCLFYCRAKLHILCLWWLDHSGMAIGTGGGSQWRERRYRRAKTMRSEQGRRRALRALLLPTSWMSTSSFAGMFLSSICWLFLLFFPRNDAFFQNFSVLAQKCGHGDSSSGTFVFLSFHYSVHLLQHWGPTCDIVQIQLFSLFSPFSFGSPLLG